VDEALLVRAKRYTNEQVIQKATNSPTETISFDNGIYSVGNNVVNGQVSVSLKGNTYTNIVKNGSFADGVIGWSTYGSGAGNIREVVTNKAFVGDKSMHIKRVANSTSMGYGYQQQNIPIITGHKYLIIGYAYVPSNITINIPPIITVTPSTTLIFSFNEGIKDVWQRKSTIFDATSSTTSVIAGLGNALGSEGEVYYDGISLFDLTAIFGAGNEPTIEQCDKIFPHYFDGTKSTIGALRIKSVGRNIFDGEYEAGTFNAHGVASVNETRIRTKNFVKVKPNTKYTLVNEENRTIAWAFYYDVNKNMINSFSTNIVTPSNCVYIRWSYLDTTDVDIKTHLVEGDGIIPYEPYKESIVNVNLPEPLRSVPSANDEVNVTEGIKTQRVKEYVLQSDDIKSLLTTPTNIDVVTVAKQADDILIGNNTSITNSTTIEGFRCDTYGDDISKIGVHYNASIATYGLIIAKGTYVNKAAAQAALAGTTLTYQLAEPIVTKLPAQPPLQIYENGTVYVEPIGDASESTLPSVEMTIPTGTSNKFGVATHNYGGAAADWVLTNSESKCFLLAVSNAGGAANIIAPNRPGTMYAISNASGHTITIKISGGNGVKVTNAKTVLVIHNGTDYVALTAEL
jgi:hypothetical protein